MNLEYIPSNYKAVWHLELTKAEIEAVVPITADKWAAIINGCDVEGTLLALGVVAGKIEQNEERDNG